MGAGANVGSGKHKKVLCSIKYILKGEYYSQLYSHFLRINCYFYSVDRVLVAG